ncbi:MULTISPECIES: ferredoxin [Mycolicibacterium]|nr:ferredoxin [Mycolicibacterium hassiacum]MBX5486474.1 ferredoxin [Mycolicibacterium hassiacum]PZN25365.1 MAG: ferredoxin [Mycolicibacterium hassiacum]
MRLRVDRSACMGHALCNAVSDELFPLDDEGYTALQDRDIAPEDEPLVRRAVDSCPERALTLETD